MKTPMQELIESITLLDSKGHIVLIPTISKAEIESLLEKEKKVIIEAYNHAYEEGWESNNWEPEVYYNETYGGNK